MTTPLAPGTPAAAPAASAQAPAQPAKPKHPYARPATKAAPPAAPPAPKHPYAKPAPVAPGAERARTVIPAKPAQAPAPTPPAAAAPKPGAPTPRQSAQRERVMARLEAQASRAKQLEARLSGYAKAELSKLDENARKFVRELAGDDADKQLELIEKMRASNVLRTAAASAKPASTAPSKASAQGPAHASTDADAALYQRWNKLRTEAPIAASSLYLANKQAIDRAKARLSKQ